MRGLVPLDALQASERAREALGRQLGEVQALLAQQRLKHGAVRLAFVGYFASLRQDGLLRTAFATWRMVAAASKVRRAGVGRHTRLEPQGGLQAVPGKGGVRQLSCEHAWCGPWSPLPCPPSRVLHTQAERRTEGPAGQLTLTLAPHHTSKPLRRTSVAPRARQGS